MTLARLLETGSGQMASRIVIEGLPIVPVSDPNMQRSAAHDGALVKTSDDANLYIVAPDAVTWFPDVGTTVTSGLRDPAGGTGAKRISESSASTIGALGDSVSYTPNDEMWVSAWVEVDDAAANFAAIHLVTGASTHGVRIHLGTGELATHVGTVNDATAVLHGHPTRRGYGDRWWFVSFRCPGDAVAVTAEIRITPAAGLAASFSTTSAAATGGVTIYGPRIASRTVDATAADPTTGQGRERVYCYDHDGPSAVGLIIDESVNIPEAVLEAPGTSIRLTERDDEILSQSFEWRPDIERYIAQNVDISDTTVTLFGSADGVAANDVIHVGTEAMLVTGVSSLVLTVERGYYQTIAQKHWSGEGGIALRTLHNRPMSVRGRRVYLYLYGDADDLQGDGTQVWIGHVSGKPSLDEAGAVWRLQVASIAERLKGKLGGELDQPLVPRGIYYSWAAPLRISLGENGTGVFPPAGVGLSDFTGFYETQADFVAALTTWLGTLKTALGLSSTYTAIEVGERWTVQVVVGAAVTDVTVHVQSSQDGETSEFSTYMQTTAEGGSSVGTLTTGDLIYPLWTPRYVDDRIVPRGHFDAWAAGPTPPARVPADRTTFPERRVYLDRSVGADWTGLIVEWPGRSHDHSILVADVTDNFIEISPVRDFGGALSDYRYGAYSPPQFRPTRSLGTGTLEDLRAGLVANGPEYCNRAGMPFLSSADLASWADVIDEAARGRSWLLERTYTMMQSVDLEDLLQHEMRLFGVFPIIDSDGKIGVQSLARVIEGGVPTTIDAADELVSVGWSTLQQGGQTINTVKLKTGYDPAEDEWLGGEIIAQDYSAYAEDHEERTLDIEPRPRAAEGDEQIPRTDAADVMRRVSDIYGYPHDFVVAHVPWTHFHLRIGDAVSLSADHLPDYRTGRRPMTEARAIVVARKWPIGEAHGTLRLLVHGLNVSGYAPTARITGAAENATDEWIVGLDTTLYAPADGVPGSFFATGDKVRLIEYDSESPTIVTGTMGTVSVGTNEYTVNVDSTWTPGAATWELCSGAYGDVTDGQQGYAFIAEDGLLGTANAGVYSP